jgi:transcriptional regulator with XRE-family HTH domain
VAGKVRLASDSQVNLFGQRIRDRRTALGMSLRELGKEVDLTASFLAQVERGLANPSLVSLQQIAHVLQVPIFYFFTEERSRQRVVRRDGRRQLHFPDANITYELLLPSLNHKSMGLVIRLGPGDHINPLRLSEPTEEWLLVLQGKIKIVVAGEEYELESGDAVSYEGWELQELACVGEGEAVLVGSMTPPAF